MAFEKFSVADLRDILVASGLSQDEAKAIKGKSDLVYKIKLLQNDNKIDSNIELTYYCNTPVVPEENLDVKVVTDDTLTDELMNSIEQLGEKTKELTDELLKENLVSQQVLQVDEPNVIGLDMKPTENIPDINSEEWQDFIMSRFLPEEMDKGNPKVAGLRRLARKYLGDFIFSAPTQVFPSTAVDGPGRATVVYEIRILWKLGIPAYVNPTNWDFLEVTFGGVGEGWDGNIKGEAFKVHPVTIAETRAEGRALRKALNLRNILAAEELGSSELLPEAEAKVVTEYNEQDTASAAQQSFIKTMCNRMKIDVDKLCPNLSKMTKEQALALNKKLTEYQQHVELIPSDLLIKE